MHDLLTLFKDERDPINLVFLVDNLDAMRVCAAWPYVDCQLNKKRLDALASDAWGTLKCDELKSDILRRVWADLWSCAKPDLHELARMSGLPLDKTACVFLTLRNARLIFPDRTIHSQAKKIIGTYITRRITK